MLRIRAATLSLPSIEPVAASMPTRSTPRFRQHSPSFVAFWLSIPLALATAVADGRIKKGDLVLLEAMGGGFTWGSALVRW